MFCTASETDVEVVHVKLYILNPPPVTHYWPFQCGGFVVVLCCPFLVSDFTLRVHIIFSYVWVDE